MVNREKFLFRVNYPFKLNDSRGETNWISAVTAAGMWSDGSFIGCRRGLQQNRCKLFDLWVEQVFSISHACSFKSWESKMVIRSCGALHTRLNKNKSTEKCLNSKNMRHERTN